MENHGLVAGKGLKWEAVGRMRFRGLFSWNVVGKQAVLRR